MTEQINAILFDVGGTLRSSAPTSEQEKREYFQQIIDLIHADASVEVFSKLLTDRARAYRRWTEEVLVELSEQDLWTQWMLPDWPAEVVAANAVKLTQLYRTALSTRILYPETFTVLLELYRRGYRLGLVSNTTSSVETPALLNELKLTGCFETVVLSTLAGTRKPDPSMLQQATHQMDIDPIHCAYIGNSPEKDVVAARKAGFGKTIILRNTPDKQSLVDGDPMLMPDHYIGSLNDLLEIFPAREPVQPAVVYRAALSTMWAMQNFPSLSDFHEFARRMGFSGIELNHKVDSSMLEGNNFGRYSVGSVHEPCPADISVETLKKRDWLVSALDEQNRREGVKAVQRSIDLADRFGARVVIVHVGTIQLDFSLEKKLGLLYESGKKNSPEFLDIKGQMICQRARLSAAGMASVKKSLLELLDYASRFGISIGLENRYHFMEFPSPDELDVLLGMARANQLGFIYDVGHAQHLSRLGFYPHDEWLKRFGRRIIGTHLHDMVGLQDHYAPGLGDVDFDLIADYLPKNAFRTCEFMEFNSPEQVKAGLKYLFDHRCITTL